MFSAQQMNQTTGNLLVVDDDKEILDITVRLLKKAGHNVVSAETGEQCLEEVHRSKPDLVLLDVNLPDINGYEVCRRLKSDARLSNTFVVFCSSEQKTPENIEEGTNAGGSGYIFRPVSNSELVARVNAFFETRKTFEQIRNSEKRFRALFEGNPQPILIFNVQTRQIIDANPAALVLYGFGYTEALARTSASLFTEEQNDLFWELNAPDNVTDTHANRFTQKRHDGFTVETEIISHPLDWNGTNALAVFVTDISDKLELDAAKSQDDSLLQDELSQLENRQGSIPIITAESLGLKKLSDSSPVLFSELCLNYESQLQALHEERVYKIDSQSDQGLRMLADRMFILRCGPRDATEVHIKVIKSMLKADAKTATALMETARIALLQLMGYLVASYRNHHVSRNQVKSDQ